MGQEEDFEQKAAKKAKKRTNIVSSAKAAKIEIPEKEKTILRQLAEKQAKIAALPVHKQKIAEWTRLNDNKPGRPLVWINEIPWHEMNVNDELTIQTTTRICRRIEDTLRKTIYQWNHVLSRAV